MDSSYTDEMDKKCGSCNNGLESEIVGIKSNELINSDQE